MKPWSNKLPAWVIVPLTAFIITRAIVFTGGLVATFAFSDGYEFVYRDYEHKAFDPWGGWDGAWYRNIVENGYFYYPAEQSSAAFFPVLPLLMSVFNVVIGNLNLTGMLINAVAFALALMLLYRLTTLDLDEESAARAVWYTAVFPTAFYYSAVYTESLFLLFTVGAFYAARRRWWAWAVLAGILATATRSIGILIWGAVGLEWMRSVGWTIDALHTRAAWRNLWEGLRREWAIVILICLIPAGLLSFIIFQARELDAPDAFLATQVHWNRRTSNPLDTLWGDFRRLRYTDLEGGYLPYETLVNFSSAVAGLAVGTLAWRRLGASYGAFAMLSMLIPLFTTTLSFARFLGVIFPVFMMLGLWGKAEWLDRALVIGFSVFLGIFSAMFLNAWFIA